MAVDLNVPRPLWHAKNIFQILRFYLKGLESYAYFYNHLSPVLFQWFDSLAQAVMSQAENRPLKKGVH